jgi:hypothetical protein
MKRGNVFSGHANRINVLDGVLTFSVIRFRRSLIGLVCTTPYSLRLLW